MSGDNYWFFRATIDFTVWDERLAKELNRNKNSTFADEQLGRKVSEAARDGGVEIDAINKIEIHGSHDES